MFAIMTSQDPVFGYVAGFVLAGGATLPVHLGKGFLRLGSHATTAGFGSPALSVAEDATSVGAITLSIFLPVLAVAFGAVSLLFVFWLINKLRRRAKAT